MHLKRYSFCIAAFVIPIIVYFWVILGWTAGEDCGAGVWGAVPSGITNYLYCQQQVDSGAYAWQHIPHWHLVAKDWLSGVIPLWNPHQGLGVPLAANFISGAFNPVMVIFNAAGSLLITRWYLVFRLSLASLGMYLCLRELKYRKWPSLAGATLFVLNGYITQFFSINHHDVDFFLPWLVLCAIKAKQNRLWWVLSAVLLCLSVFAGMPESNLFVFGVYGLLGLWLGWGLPRKEKIVYYIHLIASSVIGIALSAILLIPGLEYVTQAFQSRLIGLGNIYSTGFKNIFFWVLPRTFGLQLNILTQSQSLGVLNINYIGLVATVLVLASLLTRLRFTGVLLLFLLAQYFGIIRLPLDKFPILRDTVFIKYSLEVINFLAAIELANGMSLWISKINKKKVLLVLGSILLVSILFLQKDLVVALSGRYLWQAKGTTAFILLQTIFAVGLLLALLKTKNERLISLLVIGELVIYLPWVGSRLRTTQVESPAFVQFLQTHNDGSRIFSPDSILYPDYASYFKLNDIRDVDALWPNDYYQYIKAFIQPDMDLAFLHFGSAQDTASQKPVQVTNNPFLNELSVKYLVYREATESAQLKLVFDDKVKVYENLAAFPRAWFVSNVLCTNNELETMHKVANDLRNTAVQTGSGCQNLQNLAQGKILNSQFFENKITFDYESTTSGYIVMSDTYYPGWKVFVNNQSVAIDKVNMTLRGIVVPSSDHGKVVVEYKPVSFQWGLLISGLGLAVLLLYFLLISLLRL